MAPTYWYQIQYSYAQSFIGCRYFIAAELPDSGMASASCDAPAVGTDGKSSEKKSVKSKLAKFRMAARIAAPPPRAAPTPLKRTLTVRLIEINRLTDIDIIKQCFMAEILVQFAFEGGNNDPFLVDPNPEFPLDAYGRPTFRPSAAWYMAQLDFNNALDYKVLDSKLVPSGDDLLITFRAEGTFSEIMELEDFPCDVQDLSVSLAFNCRTTGMMPLEIITSSELKTAVAQEGFVGGQTWNLYKNVAVRPGEVGSHVDRKFPSVEFTLVLGRQPSFYLLNIALPVFFFPMMAMVS